MKYKRLFLNIFWLFIIAYLSYNMPFFADDYDHMKSFATGERLDGISAIFTSVVTYYNTWGGRAVSMTLIQLMLLLPRMVYAICNGFIYVFIVNIVIKYSDCKNEDDSFVKLETLAFSFLFTWFFMPDFYDVITWTTGSITYLWMNTVILFFGYLYYKDFIIKNNALTERNEEENHYVLGKCVVYVLIGLMAGWSNEASGATLVVGLLLYLGWAVLQKKKIAIEKICGVIACFIGYGFLIIAPGNFVRASQASAASESAGVIMVYLHRLGRETFYSLIFLLFPFIISMTLYFLENLVMADNKKQFSFAQIKTDFARGKQVFFVLLAFVSVYVMTFSAGFANRIFHFPMMLLAVVFAMSVRGILVIIQNKKCFDKMKFIIDCFIILMLLMVIVEIVTGILYSNQTGSFFDRRMFYYYMDDSSNMGLFPGNGING